MATNIYSTRLIKIRNGTKEAACIERAEKSIVIRARAIRLHAGLPKEYANECAMTAIYLLNRTPVEAIDWSCLYTKVKGVKPSVAHLEVIGARAYVLLPRARAAAAPIPHPPPAATNRRAKRRRHQPLLRAARVTVTG
jgi:hypothetical protein